MKRGMVCQEITRVECKKAVLEAVIHILAPSAIGDRAKIIRTES